MSLQEQHVMLDCQIEGPQQRNKSLEDHCLVFFLNLLDFVSYTSQTYT